MKKTRTLSIKVAFMLLGLLALILLLAAGVVYRTNASRLSSLKVQLTAKQSELAGAEARLAQQPQLQADYESLKADLAVLEPAVPSRDYVPTFLGQIERLAQASGNKVTGVRPLKEAGPKQAQPPAAQGSPAAPAGAAQAPQPNPALAQYQRLPLEVTMRGDFWSTVTFLQRMATFPKLVAVTEFTVSPLNEKGDELRPQLEVQAKMLALVHKGE